MRSKNIQLVIMMKKIMFLSILGLVIFLMGCAKELEKGLTKTGGEIVEIERESERINAAGDELMLRDCCDACTYNYGQDPKPDETSCIDVINQNRDSLYNVREDQILDQCIEIFKANPQTIATCQR